MNKTKVFAMYLPQYHETEENNKFWGQGFTDWVSVKKATPLFEGHIQPKVPENENYYDLSVKENIKWQAELAKEYGIDGFGVYHYWFNSEEQTLTKPAEIILANKDINIPFFFAWDNASWKRTWSKIKGNDWSPLVDEKKPEQQKGPEILIEYKVGNEKDWQIHFEYLLPYFCDQRYEKHNGKPVFLIYNYSDEIQRMAEFWNQCAINVGFEGIEIVYSFNPLHGIPKTATKFRYEPLYSGWGRFFDRLARLLNRNKIQKNVLKYSYDRVWKQIIRSAKSCHDKNMYYGAFVNYDDTPRRGNKGKIILDSTPDKFHNYLQELLDVCNRQGKEYIFLTAWNEWGEGAYLEPDTLNGLDYLKAFEKAHRML